MSRRPLAARLTATALIALATTATAVLPAHSATGPTSATGATGATGATNGAGSPASANDSSDYELLLTSETARTDFDHRTIDLLGTLIHTDGTPVANAPVDLGQQMLYETWNPWGDPIDPIERETRSLGTVLTDENGHFSLPDVTVDRWQTTPSTFLKPIDEVEFTADWDSDPAHDDPLNHDIVFGQYDVATTPVTSSITYKVNKTKVRDGDTLTVTGQVSWPAGHGPVAGTRVYLRTYFENEENAETTADAEGNFSVSATIGEWDDQFVLFSAPTDYYIAGASQDLPVKHVTQPVKNVTR